jgi:hypothetical protein
MTEGYAVCLYERQRTDLRFPFSVFSDYSAVTGIYLGQTSRADSLHEAGAGPVWEFAPRWTLRPEILYIYDDGNVFVHNYGSTEV